MLVLRERKGKAAPAVYASVARHEVRQHEDVAAVPSRTAQWLRRSSGIRVRVDGDGRLHVSAAIIMRYGRDAYEVGMNVQEAIYAAIERVSDRPVGSIDVVIEGIALTQRESQRSEESRDETLRLETH